MQLSARSLRRSAALVATVVTIGGAEVLQKQGVLAEEMIAAADCSVVVEIDSEVVFSSSGQAEFNSWERGWDDIALIHSKELAADIENQVFKNSLAEDACNEVTLESLKKETLWTRIKTTVITFFYNIFANTYRFFVSPHLNDEPRRIMIAPEATPPAWNVDAAKKATPSLKKPAA